MDLINGIIGGFAVALQPINLFAALIGALVGTATGVLPGLRRARRHGYIDADYVSLLGSHRPHHVIWNLLRCHVRRLNNRYSA